MSFYRPLHDIALPHLAEYGAKAAHLGQAAQLGCRVPEGVVLSTGIYRRFMLRGGLAGEISSILATLQPTAMPHFQAAEWAIQEAFHVRRIPDEVDDAIRGAFRACGCTQVVVRSSATSEQGVGYSFVGQHAASLGVESEDKAVEAVLACWMSIYSAKALSYAHHFGLNLRDAAMGVVLQRMVSYTVDGSLFTVDPISGNPDSFILEVHAGPQQGVHRLNPYAPQADEPPYWAQLREIGLRLDEHGRAFQTVKWSLVGDEVYLLRVRPATRIPPYLPEAALDLAGTPGPLELMRPPGVSPRQLAPYSWYHRSRSPSLSAAYFRHTSRLFARFWGRDDRYLCGYLYSRWRRTGFPAFDEDVGALRRLLHSLRRLAVARTLDRDYRLLWRTRRPRLDTLNQTDLTRLSGQELGGFLIEAMELNEAFSAETGRLGECQRALVDMLHRLHQRWVGPAVAEQVLWVAEDDQAQRRDEALTRILARSHSDEVARDAEVAAVLRRYRHLYLEGQPLMDGQDILALRTDQRALSEATRALGARGAAHPAAKSRAELAAEREAVERAALARLNRAQAAIYRQVLALVRRYAPLTVNRDEPMLLAWLLEKEAMGEVGRRLCAQSLAEDAQDAGLLTWREALDWLNGALSQEALRRTLAERRDLRRRYWRYAPPNTVGDGPVRPAISLAVPAAEAEVLRGLAVSPGVAQGRARVAITLGEAAQVLPGEVLVMREPLFSLSPLFGVVSAVVAEGGWLLADEAVLAREYGVPAVFRVEGATSRIITGEELQVDANSGVVIRRLVEPDLEFP